MLVVVDHYLTPRSWSAVFPFRGPGPRKNSFPFSGVMLSQVRASRFPFESGIPWDTISADMGRLDPENGKLLLPLAFVSSTTDEACHERLSRIDLAFGKTRSLSNKTSLIVRIYSTPARLFSPPFSDILRPLHRLHDRPGSERPGFVLFPFPWRAYPLFCLLMSSSFERDLTR